MKEENTKPESKDDFYTSWSELGGAIALAAEISSNDDTDGNTKVVRQSSRRFINRRSSDGESWVCGNCTYMNCDGVAAFCGVCGKARD